MLDNRLWKFSKNVTKGRGIKGKLWVDETQFCAQVKLVEVFVRDRQTHTHTDVWASWSFGCVDERTDFALIRLRLHLFFHIWIFFGLFFFAHLYAAFRHSSPQVTYRRTSGLLLFWKFLKFKWLGRCWSVSSAVERPCYASKSHLFILPPPPLLLFLLWFICTHFLFQISVLKWKLILSFSDNKKSCVCLWLLFALSMESCTSLSPHFTLIAPCPVFKLNWVMESFFP